jgi:hypothetical protein
MYEFRKQNWNRFFVRIYCSCRSNTGRHVRSSAGASCGFIHLNPQEVWEKQRPGRVDKGIERTYRLLAVLSDDQGLCALAFQCKECKALALRPSKAKRKQRNNAEMLRNLHWITHRYSGACTGYKTCLFARGLTSYLSLGASFATRPGRVEFLCLSRLVVLTILFLRELKISSNVTVRQIRKIIKKNSVSQEC